MSRCLSDAAIAARFFRICGFRVIHIIILADRSVVVVNVLWSHSQMCFSNHLLPTDFDGWHWNYWKSYRKCSSSRLKVYPKCYIIDEKGEFQLISRLFCDVLPGTTVV